MLILFNNDNPKQLVKLREYQLIGHNKNTQSYLKNHID